MNQLRLPSELHHHAEMNVKHGQPPPPSSSSSGRMPPLDMVGPHFGTLAFNAPCRGCPLRFLHPLTVIRNATSNHRSRCSRSTQSPSWGKMTGRVERPSIPRGFPLLTFLRVFFSGTKSSRSA